MASNRKPETLVARHFRTSTLPCTRLSGLPILCSLGPCSIETRIENGKPTYDSLGSGYSSTDSGLGTGIENGKLSYVALPDPFMYSLSSLSLCRFREIMYSMPLRLARTCLPNHQICVDTLRFPRYLYAFSMARCNEPSNNRNEESW